MGVPVPEGIVTTLNSPQLGQVKGLVLKVLTGNIILHAGHQAAALFPNAQIGNDLLFNRFSGICLYDS